MNNNTFNAIGILILSLCVGCGLFIETVLLKPPCILCFLQRSCMILIALGLYWNIAYGNRVKHYGFSLLAALLGLACSLRHMALNVCKPVGESSIYFCSYRVYTWSFSIFFASLLSLSLLLFFYKECPPLSRKVSLTFKGLLGLVLLFCIISVLYRRGFGF